MILHNEVDVMAQGVARSPASSWKKGRLNSVWLFRFIVLLSFFALVVLLQWLSGTYRSEFSSYPDEPAHYVTSLMVWDYIRQFHFVSPLSFAQSYYDHYPKVALGHWPPVFYLIQAGWMLVFGTSRIAVRLEVGLTTAILALSLFSELRKRFGDGLFAKLGALGAGVLFICLPLVQVYTAEEMAEMMLTLCCFWGVVFLARFIHGGRSKDALLYAVFFSLAVLTKGSGWLLAMVPAIALVLTRQLTLLRRKALWLSALVVALCCVPWQLMTMKMAERGWEGGTHPSAHYSIGALWEFLTLFPSILGPLLVAVMVIGIYRLIVVPFRQGRTNAFDACMFSLLCSVWLFHSLVPAGVEDRKLIIAVPAMIYFLLPGVHTIVRWLPPVTGRFDWRAPAVAGILAISFAAFTFSIPRVDGYGFHQAARFIASRPEIEHNNILVTSQSVGEGLLVSELAMLRPDPIATVIRATKALATVEWNGAGYQCRYSDTKQVLDFIRSKNIGVIVIDNFAPQVNFLHDKLIHQLVTTSPSFQLIGQFRSQDPVQGSVSIYKTKL